MSLPRSWSPADVIDLPDPHTASNVTYNPSISRLRELARAEERTTEYGSAGYYSEFTSRSADQTANTIDHEFTEEDIDLVAQAIELAHDADMLCLDRKLGSHPDHTYVCRYYVPTGYARIAHAWAKLLEPAEEGAPPDFRTLQVPDHDITAIRVFPDERFTAVIGSDYTGEAKKSFLRQFMYEVKRNGGIGLHAGSKQVTVGGDEVGQLFMGLSATGKTTLTTHGYGLQDGSVRVMQDDVCGLLPDGSAVGSEGYGMYVKTAGLDPDEQAELYNGVTHESAVFENVYIDEDGRVDFDDDTYTANGRAVVLREHVSIAPGTIDLDGVDQLFFITRNPICPPVARLTPDQAAVAFMLGESVETSAGDPDRAGESIRVVGTNPFIIGSRAEEGNLLRGLVDHLDIDSYLLNTGHLGQQAQDIGVEDSADILKAIAQDKVEWRYDETLSLEVPHAVPGVDSTLFDVAAHVDDLEAKVRYQRDDRRAYLRQFDGLAPAILDAVY